MVGKTTVRELGEDLLVSRICAGLATGSGVIASAGDDCAVLKPPRAGQALLFKTDCMVEGVHFTAETPAELVGRKALARALSDIAAMGGVPRHALVTLMMPPQTKVHYVDGLYRGMNALAKQYQVALVGGETSQAPLITLTIALLGEALARGWIRRGGAKAGDAIYVTGRLGGSIQGHHLKFDPRLAEGQWLARQGHPHAMMDLSDGLAKDLPRMASAAGLGFEVDFSHLPRRRGCTPQQAWSDGEDYELLLAVPEKGQDKMKSGWARHFPKVPLTCIGHFVRDRSTVPSDLAGGWDHFSNPATA